jgi:hypothetical protein
VLDSLTLTVALPDAAGDRLTALPLLLDDAAADWLGDPEPPEYTGDCDTLLDGDTATGDNTDDPLAAELPDAAGDRLPLLLGDTAGD